MKMQEIIEHLEYLDFQNFKLGKENSLLEYQLRTIKKAIERGGLEKHIEALIKEIEDDADEVPF